MAAECRSYSIDLIWNGRATDHSSYKQSLKCLGEARQSDPARPHPSSAAPVMLFVVQRPCDQRWDKSLIQMIEHVWPQATPFGDIDTNRPSKKLPINGEVYVKPDRFKRWVPTQPERNVLQEQKVILIEREDTATVERKIGGIKGKPRYYAIDVRALDRLASR